MKSYEPTRAMSQWQELRAKQNFSNAKQEPSKGRRSKVRELLRATSQELRAIIYQQVQEQLAKHVAHFQGKKVQ